MTKVPCEACGAFAVDCIQPGGDGDEGEVGLCWLCAHLIADHDVTPSEAKAAWLSGTCVCSCAREEIYPAEVIARMDANRRASDAALAAQWPFLWRGEVREDKEKKR